MTVDPMSPKQNPDAWMSNWRVYARQHGGVPARYYDEFLEVACAKYVSISGLDTLIRSRFAGWPWLCEFCGGDIGEGATCRGCGADAFAVKS